MCVSQGSPRTSRLRLMSTHELWHVAPLSALVWLVKNIMTNWDFLFSLHRYIGKSDSITISVWNHKKIHKKQGAGFLGCVRLLSNAINRLKDTGCKCMFLSIFLILGLIHCFYWPPQWALSPSKRCGTTFVPQFPQFHSDDSLQW